MISSLVKFLKDEIKMVCESPTNIASMLPFTPFMVPPFEELGQEEGEAKAGLDKLFCADINCLE